MSHCLQKMFLSALVGLLFTSFAAALTITGTKEEGGTWNKKFPVPAESIVDGSMSGDDFRDYGACLNFESSSWMSLTFTVDADDAHVITVDLEGDGKDNLLERDGRYIPIPWMLDPSKKDSTSRTLTIEKGNPKSIKVSTLRCAPGMRIKASGG